MTTYLLLLSLSKDDAISWGLWGIATVIGAYFHLYVLLNVVFGGDIPSLCSFEWKLCLQESGATTFSQVDCRDKYCRSACDARLSSLCIKAFYAAIIQADSSEALSAALRAVNLEEMTGKPDTQYLLASPAFISENMKQLVAAGYRPLVETPTGDGYLRSLWYRP